jgi:hypothetical protein
MIQVGVIALTGVDDGGKIPGDIVGINELFPRLFVD